MTSDVLTANIIVAAILLPIVWFLLRDLRSVMQGIRTELANLVLAMSLDIATRPNAAEGVRRVAEKLIEEHKGV